MVARTPGGYTIAVSTGADSIRSSTVLRAHVVLDVSLPHKSLGARFQTGGKLSLKAIIEIRGRAVDYTDQANA